MTHIINMKSYFFEKNDKLDVLLIRQSKTKRGKSQVNNIENKKGIYSRLLKNVKEHVYTHPKLKLQIFS